MRISGRLRTALAVLLLFIIAWLPRVFALDSFVTIDERKWLARSANFTYALAEGDLAATFQREHPGVTVMWAGALGLLSHFPEYAAQAPGYFGWDREEIEAWLTASTSHTPLELLSAGRWWVVLAVTLALVLGYFPLRRLLGANIAFFAILYLALSPFIVALARQLHPDGLVSSFIFLALLYFLAWLYAGRRWSDLVISGVAMGLAWLTKTPAAFLVPTGLLLVALEAWRLRFNRRAALARLGAGYVLWGVIATAVFVLLWPAMWLDPLGTLGRMAAEMGAYVEGHTNVNYFAGQPTDDPGVLFYPLAYFFRITPATAVGLVVAAIAFVRRGWPLNQGLTRRTVMALTIFALIFAAAMTIPAKKFDRYILPVFFALDVVAVVGWAALIQLPWQYGMRAWVTRLRAVSPAVWALAVIIPAHSIFTLATTPYYFTYYNPLAGGALTAPWALFVGWGEGLEDAAAYLNRQPEGENLRVAAWYADGPFSYYFDGQAVPMGYTSPLSWMDIDYAVTYANQWQRQLPSPAAVDYFRALTPVHTVRAGGLELANVYDMRQVLMPAFIDFDSSAAADWQPGIRLVGHQLEPVNATPGAGLQPGDELLLTLYLQSQAPIDRNYNVLVRLVDAQGNEHWRSEGWPWGAPTAGWPLREVRPDGHTVALPADLPAGLYKLVVSFYDPATLDLLPATDLRSGQPLDPPVRDVALLQVGESTLATPMLTPPPHFGAAIALSRAALSTTARPGEALTALLTWTALAQPARDYTVFVHVLDAAGNLVAQLDQPPLAGFAPTQLWQPGMTLVDQLAVPLPEELPEGEYTVRIGLYSAEGRLPVTREGAPAGDAIELGTVMVRCCPARLP